MLEVALVRVDGQSNLLAKEGVFDQTVRLAQHVERRERHALLFDLDLGVIQYRSNIEIVSIFDRYIVDISSMRYRSNIEI